MRKGKKNKLKKDYMKEDMSSAVMLNVVSDDPLSLPGSVGGKVMEPPTLPK